jgi:hypothetical protein
LEKYPQYRRIVSRVPEPPAVSHPASDAGKEWRQDRITESLGEIYSENTSKYDIAPELGCEAKDWIATTTRQAGALLREHGIWNILLTGFDTYGCIITSPGGVLDMSRLGYRCFIVAEATSTNETFETREEGQIREAALLTTELLGYSYTVRAGDLLAAIHGAEGK